MFSLRNHAAFTLLELVAVCAAIAILACLAIPVISGGLMSANRAKCASNMRQIGTAVRLYAADNNGMLPVTTHNTGDSKFKINGQWVNTIEYSWVYVLADYLNNVDEIRICPADEKDRQKRIRELNATSYLVNDVVFDSEEYRHVLRIPMPARTAILFISNRPVSRPGITLIAPSGRLGVPLMKTQHPTGIAVGPAPQTGSTVPQTTFSQTAMSKTYPQRR